MHLCMSTWSDYPIFLAVAETGSLTAAGIRLGMSQPTVGRRIRVLESDFGAPLLTKEDGKLVPTEFGYLILDHIRRMESEAGAIKRTSATLEHSLVGPVMLTATEGLGDWWLPAVMQLFRADNPDIIVDINIDVRSVNLAQREADIALRWMGPGTQNSLVGRKVTTFGFGLYASKSYIQRKGLPLNPEDLNDHDGVELYMTGESDFWPTYDDGKSLPRPRTTFRTNNLMSHHHAILAGYGVGMLPHCAVQPEHNLVRIFPQRERLEDLWVVAHEDIKRSARVRAAFDFIVSALKQDKDHFRRGSPSVFIECVISLDTPGGQFSTKSENAKVVSRGKTVA